MIDGNIPVFQTFVCKQNIHCGVKKIEKSLPASLLSHLSLYLNNYKFWSHSYHQQNLYMMKHSIAERVGQCGANLGSSGSPKAKWNKCGEQATSHAASFVPHFCSPSTATTFLHTHYYKKYTFCISQPTFFAHLRPIIHILQLLQHYF